MALTSALPANKSVSQVTHHALGHCGPVHIRAPFWPSCSNRGPPVCECLYFSLLKSLFLFLTPLHTTFFKSTLDSAPHCGHFISRVLTGACSEGLLSILLPLTMGVWNIEKNGCQDSLQLPSACLTEYIQLTVLVTVTEILRRPGDQVLIYNYGK